MGKYKIRIHPSRVDEMMGMLAFLAKVDDEPEIFAMLMTHFFIRHVYDKKAKEYVEDTEIAGEYVLSQLKKIGVEGLMLKAIKQIKKLCIETIKEVE